LCVFSCAVISKGLLYCVNSSAELFQIDPLNGKLTYLSDMPMGSVTCAIDFKCLYSVGKKPVPTEIFYCY
jgi:hypothetical protein